MKILVNQLVHSSTFNTTIDLQNSTYFSKNYQPVEKTMIASNTEMFPQNASGDQPVRASLTDSVKDNYFSVGQAQAQTQLT